MMGLDRIVDFRQAQGARQRQEDTLDVVFVSPRGRKPQELLLLVADGMGGHTGGAEASAAAVQAFRSHYRSEAESLNGAQLGVPERLMNALNAANAAVGAAAASNPALAGMGTTLVAAVIESGNLHFVSVGDSLLWRYTPPETLARVNESHAYGAYLDRQVAEGAITQEQAASDSRRNALMSSLTGAAIAQVSRSEAPLSLRAGDVLILATDGVEVVPPEADGRRVGITELAREHFRSASDLAKAIIDEVDARADPHQDNASLICFSYQPANPDAVTAPLTVTPEQMRRSSPAPMIAAGVVALLVVGAGLGYWFWSRSQEGAKPAPATESVSRPAPAASPPSVTPAPAGAPQSPPATPPNAATPAPEKGDAKGAPRGN